MAYAERTSVSVENSKADIERVLSKYGADQFMSGWQEGMAMVAFRMNGRHVRFLLPMPGQNEHRFTHHSRGERTTSAALKEWEQACRQRWRALLLVVKAKLEACEAGITEFDDEFMAHIVLPSGETMGDRYKPQIALAYEQGDMPPLLPDYTA